MAHIYQVDGINQCGRVKSGADRRPGSAGDVAWRIRYGHCCIQRGATPVVGYPFPTTKITTTEYFCEFRLVSASLSGLDIVHLIRDTWYFFQFGN